MKMVLYIYFILGMKCIPIQIYQQPLLNGHTSVMTEVLPCPVLQMTKCAKLSYLLYLHTGFKKQAQLLKIAMLQKYGDRDSILSEKHVGKKVHAVIDLTALLAHGLLWLTNAMKTKPIMEEGPDKFSAIKIMVLSQEPFMMTKKYC